jgi:quaternary ammonium compound-resistance protein SugE
MFYLTESGVRRLDGNGIPCTSPHDRRTDRGDSMAWVYLIVAGLCEIGWPVGLKLSQTPGRLVLGVVIAVVCMAASGAFLWLAQKTIPIGTAYAVWTGIGAAGTFVVGILFYGDSASALRLVSVGLIVAGIIGLKLAQGPG